MESLIYLSSEVLEKQEGPCSKLMVQEQWTFDSRRPLSACSGTHVESSCVTKCFGGDQHTCLSKVSIQWSAITP